MKIETTEWFERAKYVSAWTAVRGVTASGGAAVESIVGVCCEGLASLVDIPNTAKAIRFHAYDHPGPERLIVERPRGCRVSVDGNTAYTWQSTSWYLKDLLGPGRSKVHVEVEYSDEEEKNPKKGKA